ncbi:MAG: hypothetical protein COA64_16585, partial [Henriciella sp.]
MRCGDRLWYGCKGTARFAPDRADRIAARCAEGPVRSLGRSGGHRGSRRSRLHRTARQWPLGRDAGRRVGPARH